ncbi:MAG TPA: hypothetical protein VG452_05505 [Egibacteraceae bacterium]|nr:hypothetical protein [Egibacteraceae bacterium]
MNEPTFGRLAGASAVVAAGCFFGVGVAESGAISEELGASLLAAQGLFLVPVAIHLWRCLGAEHRAVASASAISGICSLLLWGTAPITGAWHLEAAWIALSAAWWAPTGLLLRRRRRAWGTFTVILGVAAGLDAVVTALEGRIPFWLFAALGGWKLLLSLVWMIWSGITLLRRPVVVSEAAGSR